MTKNMEAMLFMPEDLIIKEGEEAQHLFLLSKGSCEVYQNNVHENETKIGKINQGDIFGEIALISHSKRTATVQSIDYCTIAALSS